MTYKAQIGEGQCKCSKCKKFYCGARQSKGKKMIWRSPCCKAKGIDWKRAVMVRDDK